ncbi:MAG: PspC domain-containing protein [Acidimicrobiales bacterium]|jgi:phage shock protein PspC (stress-responsive transcriptional regulator)
MDIEDEVTNTEPADKESPTDEPTALRRSSTRRIIGGVASGIGERFDIDANIVRAVFVVLACLYGFGAAIYLILWVLVPRAGESDATSEELVVTEQEEKRSSRWRAIVLIAGALCLGLIFIAFYTNGPAWGSGVGSAWLIFLVIIAVLSLRGPRRRFTLGRLLTGFFLVVVSLLILVTGGFLGFVAMTGVPIRGGIGDNVYTPTSITQVKSVYRTALGKMTVDLRQVSFSGQTLSVTASVAAGDLVIEVPPGVVVDVTAHSGAQGINYPQGYENFYVAPKTGTHQGILRLHASVGVGQIELIRSIPGSQFFIN